MKKYLCYIAFFTFSICDAAFGQNCEPRSTLPTFCISTGGTPINSKDDYVNGSLRIIQKESPELYAGDIRIRGRGNSTWAMEKKPYRINLNTSGSLLGMPASARNWVLLANHADKTLIRNSVALEISRYLGMPYASPFRFVDVVLNGEYIGSYLLTDHMEVRENRIDIEEGHEEEVPGAYLVELDGFAWQEPPFITTSQGLIGTIKFPDVESEDDPSFREITDHINSFEQRLFSGAQASGPGGYLERVDKESLINWYLTNEITGNSDSFWSVYLHKKRSDDRFFLGPHWDFDIAFDNDDRVTMARYRLMADIGHDDTFRKWIIKLRRDDVFMVAVKQRWNELKADGFKEYILAKVREYADVMISSGAQEENYKRWPVLNRKIYREILFSGSYQQHVDFLYNYLSERFAWLDKELNGLPPNYDYRIVNIHSDKALSASASEVVQRNYVETPDFLWRIHPLPNGFCQILNNSGNLALTGGVNPGEPVTLSAVDAENEQQQWRITETSAGQFAIISRDGRLGLQNQNNSTTEGAPVHGVDILSFDTAEKVEMKFWLDGSVPGKWDIQKVGNLRSTFVFPNPAARSPVVRLEAQVAGEVELEVYNVVGVRLLKVIERIGPGTNDIPLKTEALPRGVYILKIDQSNFSTSTKFVLDK